MMFKVVFRLACSYTEKCRMKRRRKPFHMWLNFGAVWTTLVMNHFDSLHTPRMTQLTVGHVCI